jgi:hypothetical protein
MSIDIIIISINIENIIIKIKCIKKVRALPFNSHHMLLRHRVKHKILQGTVHKRKLSTLLIDILLKSTLLIGTLLKGSLLIGTPLRGTLLIRALLKG